MVVGHQADQVQSAVASRGVRFIQQAEQKGTGHAVMIAARVAGAPWRAAGDLLWRLSADSASALLATLVDRQTAIGTPP